MTAFAVSLIISMCLYLCIQWQRRI